jgi:hypothetical protein
VPEGREVIIRSRTRITERTEHDVRHRNSVGAVAAIVVALSAGAIVEAGKASASTTAPPSPQARVETSYDNSSITTTAGTRTWFLQLSLGAGSYLLGASGDVVNYGNPDFVRCYITVNSTVLAGVTNYVGTQAQAIAFSLAGGDKFTAKKNVVRLSCSHDAAGTTTYVDSGATLWSSAVTSISVTKVP